MDETPGHGLTRQKGTGKNVEKDMVEKDVDETRAALRRLRRELTRFYEHILEGISGVNEKIERGLEEIQKIKKGAKIA